MGFSIGLGIYLLPQTFNDKKVFPFLFIGIMLLIVATTMVSAVMPNILSEPKNKRVKR
jgi:hypothetical protein